MTPFSRYLAGIGVIAFLLGCSPVPPKTYPTPEPASISASFGRTWDAIIEHFAAQSVPIRTIERASGIIVTDEMSVTSGYASVWADCGMDVLGTPVPANRASYNVLVRGDSSASSVRVTATFRVLNAASAPYGCVSRGAYEKELLLTVKASAEKK